MSKQLPEQRVEQELAPLIRKGFLVQNDDAPGHEQAARFDDLRGSNNELLELVLDEAENAGHDEDWESVDRVRNNLLERLEIAERTLYEIRARLKSGA